MTLSASPRAPDTERKNSSAAHWFVRGFASDRVCQSTTAYKSAAWAYWTPRTTRSFSAARSPVSVA